MATAPIIKWYDVNHASEIVAPFDFGVVDAGDWGPAFTFNIWNNRGGATDVSKMEDCHITTRDMDGGTGDKQGKIVEVVRDDWFHAQVDTLAESDLQADTSKIGRSGNKPIGTTEPTVKNNAGATITPVIPSAKEILGINNNGNQVDSGGNFVTVTLRAQVPLAASAGKQNFKIRVSYRFV
ncbi:hypothetical protein RQP50_02085 [Paenibacillus sp. chi10]|uniref:Uncharacterized protein n=1 Tax=Paenibacillus suaedae TaxID=3077233 RepID=A0AAJ2N0A0_9BACL|nr:MULTISPECIES: hypothetical protein [unclassified Paenibacillus]MDT8975028.1 hypothetical protein [Paenibacillus sp. chi10]GAV10320.1 hypothetical protein PBN151_0225 [Paenibacillus sp. NAIST15-1]